MFGISAGAAHGTATIDPASGAWSYTPVADWHGADSFTVTVTDDEGNATTQTISLTVNAVVDISNDSVTTAEDSPVTISVLGNDSFEGTPTVSAVGAAALLLSGSAAAQDGGKVIQKTTISLGTATPGGGFPVYGNAFAEVMNGADATLSIEPRNTKGSSENIPLLEAGNLDIALVAGRWACRAKNAQGEAFQISLSNVDFAVIARQRVE